MKVKVHGCYSTGEIRDTVEIELAVLPRVGETIRDIPLVGAFDLFRIFDIVYSSPSGIEIYTKNGFIG